MPIPKRSQRTHQISASDVSNMSVVSLRPTSLDVCEYVYGENVASVDTINHFYESNAIGSFVIAFIYEHSPKSYENPFLTATSRSVIADIQRTSRQFSSVNVLRPLAMFCTLFRLKISQHAKSTDPLFQALRVWTEIGDICESDSFDGHRKAIVEHTLNILLLPGIHHDNYKQSDSLVSTTGTPPSHPYCPSSPSLHIPGIALSIPSPLHFRLHVITRLSFNEQGRIAHHRDFWDVKDIIGLVPGVSLAQWIGTRLAAKGLSYVSKVWKDEKSGEPPSPTVVDDLETGPTASPVISTNALSLEST